MAPNCAAFLSSALRKPLQSLALAKWGVTSPRLHAVLVPSLAYCSALALVRCAAFSRLQACNHWSYCSRWQASSAAYTFSHWKGFTLSGVWDAKPLLLAFLNIPDASASFWGTYSQPLKTTDTVERWISILQSLVVSCDHANGSYTETSSDCCNNSLGQGRDHMLRSLTETAAFRLTDSGLKPPWVRGEGRSLSPQGNRQHWRCSCTCLSRPESVLVRRLLALALFFPLFLSPC